MRRHWRLLPRVGPYARPYWLLCAGSIAATVVAAVVALAEPWPLAFVVDGILGGRDGGTAKPAPRIVTNLFGHSPVHLIMFAVIAGLVVALVANGVAVLSEYVNTKLSQRMILDFRRDLFANALRQSQAYHDQHDLGEFVARINYEASSVGEITVALPPLAQGLLTLVGMAVIAYRIDAQLALLALTVVPFIYYSTGYYGKKIEPRLRETRRLEGRSIGLVLESIPMLRVVASFCRERYEERRFNDLARRAVDARVDITVRQTLFSLAVNVTTATGTAFVLGLGAYHVLNGRLTVGELLVVIAYVHAVYTPLQQISHTLASVQEQFIFLSMSLHLLDAKPEIQDSDDAVALRPIRGAICFENVTFTYAGRDSTLVDVDFEVEPGATIGIVGRTGAGKTTLVGLMCRFLDPQAGRVLVDGHDVRDITLESLRSQVSMVHQEPMLFTGTVRENIQYGRDDATDAEVEAAARAANAHDFIAQLPAGYDTKIGGDQGTHLSGGERQRICVARAFLKDAPVLILDEPTSSIDSRTELVILDALDRLIEGRTTFLIAHRLSTIRHCDRLLVLDDGRLVEQGTHDELVTAGGVYQGLYESQNRQRVRREMARGILTRAEPDGNRNGHANGNGNGNGHHNGNGSAGAATPSWANWASW